MTPITESPGEYSIVYVSDFSARYIDTARYGPPYFLRGNSQCCFGTFDSGPSSVLSWPVRHRFAAVKAAQLVLECYGRSGSGTDELIGVCLAQMRDLEAACAKDSVVTLHMRDSSSSKGEISFCVRMQRVFTLTLRATHVAIEPSLLQPTPVYVKLSSIDHDTWDGGSCACCVRGTFSSVKSELLRRDGRSWAVFPLLQWRSTLSGDAASIDGEVCGDGVCGSLGRFRVYFPDGTVAALLSGETSFRFTFSVPVKVAAGLQAVYSCVGQITLLTDCPMLTFCCGADADPVGRNTEDLTDAERCAVQGMGGVWPSGLRLLEGVLSQQQGQLVQIREDIAWVRKCKEDVQHKLGELREQEAARGPWTSASSALRKDIEAELRTCLERQRLLEDTLVLIKERRDIAKGEYVSHSKGRVQSLHALLEEGTGIQRMLEGVEQAQSRLRSLVAVESGIDERLQRFVEEQQGVNDFDATILKGVRELRHSFP